jgi:two-component sensor histidine kinase
MNATAAPPRPRGLALLLSWPRLRFTLLLSFAWGLVLSGGWSSGPLPVLVRTVPLGLTAMLAFGLFEQWPRRLPRRVARWVLQVVAVGAVIPLGTLIIYWLSTEPGAPPFWDVEARLEGFGRITGTGVLLAPWVALGALVRQKEAMVQHQALSFELERSELERQALDARLRLLQTQVAPHFLFNTLANVQALVDARSPRASDVLRSLTAYLRAAVPRLDETTTTIGEEVALVRAYLELMHTRLPDRLQFTIHVDEAARALRCPPMTLLTLVENAVRHGIDPAEDGGRIDVHVTRTHGRCHVRVSDTGAGLRESGVDETGGTGLATLRERLQLTFGGDARVGLSAQHPRGASAEAEFPARGAAR